MRKIMMLCLALATDGALSAQEAGNANGGKKRILVLGDSITAGYGLDQQEAYPALLHKKIDAAKLPYTMKDAGGSGDTTAGGVRRIDWALVAENVWKTLESSL